MPERVTNRPWLKQTERRCYCGRPYRYAWAWAVILPARTLIDLCARCSRILRYGGQAERDELVSRLAHREEWRLAA